MSRKQEGEWKYIARGQEVVGWLFGTIRQVKAEVQS